MHERVVVLSADERANSVAALHHHPQYPFRTHCQCLLLRTEGHDVVSLDTWVATPTRATVSVFDNARIHATTFQPTRDLEEPKRAPFLAAHLLPTSTKLSRVGARSNQE